jgi:hypothetical protein
MKHIIREQWGLWCLAFSLAWVGLICVLFPAPKDAMALTEEPADLFARVQVAYRPDVRSAGEALFPEGRAEDYRRDGLSVWTQRPKGPSSLPPLDPPNRARVRTVVLLLPDPGPSLEGAERIPVQEEKPLPLPRIEP